MSVVCLTLWGHATRLFIDASEGGEETEQERDELLDLLCEQPFKS